MLRDAILEGATPAEVVIPCPDTRRRATTHLCPILRAKGWIETTAAGDYLPTWLAEL